MCTLFGLVATSFKRMADTGRVDLVPERASLHEKESSELQNSNGAELSSDPDVDEANKYPTGFRLVFIVVVLVLAIFLTSLDFVSCRNF